ncbi:tyrosine-protein phosphatase [Aestuariicella hydrocarbonica]|uniref:Tyrosine-protein phosphatase n=1 Tax=Pseudomaricurvus hydrocarbonicus TaxID=1470433 RepID=A0A9E5JX39_9GAMM|nr:tyrosine-protein phosphatase [Aestuariicella hydrocarbonica]NHO66105.1 tyrosine-protein phosphatase [Aestuariicella hydrocarbonica]
MKKHLLLAGAVSTLLFTLGCNDSQPGDDALDTRPLKERVIALHGANNFRDLGGYHTVDGHQVRYGLLYRSGQLSGLTDTDQQRITELGLRSVCDFRTATEREHNPSQLPASVERIETCNGNPATNLMQVSELMKERGIDGVDWHQFMVDAYRNIALEYTDQYRALFQQLARPQELPMLFHCTAGKDRTGFGAALVLLALGVPEATVFADYALTNQYPTAIPDAYAPIKQAAPALFEARPEFLQTALNALEQRYGGVDNYLREGLGLTDAELSAMRHNLLTPTPQ